MHYDVVVAADCEEIADVVQPHAPVYLTSPKCRNGTERVAELLFDRPEFGGVKYVVNVQGDQLDVPEFAIEGALKIVQHGVADIGTAVGPLVPASVTNPNRVKALVALLTQRCIGFTRMIALNMLTQEAGGFSVAEHVGVYAYNRVTLRYWVQLPPTPLELALGLEQVRPLEAGMCVKSAWVDQLPKVIDTAEDLVDCSGQIK